MSTRNQDQDENQTTPSGPSLKRHQIFKEDQFSFENKGLEERILKLCGDNKGNLLLFKKSIFFTETCKEESNYYDWNASLKGHNYTTGKFDIELGLHFAKDVPDISELQPGRYKIILKFYNPYKAKKNKIFGCVDTQSIEFTVGSGSMASSRGGLSGNRQDAGPGLQNLAILDTIGQTVGKVGEILNKSMEIHQNTLSYSEKIKKEAYDEGYERRRQEEEKDRQMKDLQDRLDRLENAPATTNDKTPSGDENFIIAMLKKLGMIPDIDYSNLSADQISKMMSEIGKQEKTVPEVKK